MITLTPRISYTTKPGDVTWLIPEAEHTTERPFCQYRDCACHYDSDRVECYMVQPIERGEIGIPEALDVFYNRRAEVSA